MSESKPPPQSQPIRWHGDLTDLTMSQERTRRTGWPVSDVAERLYRDRLKTILADVTDQELITEWSKTTWESNDPRMDAMVDEIERRGLDF